MNETGQNGMIIRLLAETSIHAGIGQSTGALDLPVARERTTHYPVIPGSGVKGAFRVWAAEKAGLDAKVSRLFGASADEDSGTDEGAGSVIFSDARLLLLPVRCLSDTFKWVTCPALLRRLSKDCARVGVSINMPVVQVAGTTYLGANTSDSDLALEELEFSRSGDIDPRIIDILAGMLTREEIEQRLVILSDQDFTWFARYALPIAARNVLNEAKISQNLWYEETLPPDTVMHAILGPRSGNEGITDVTNKIETVSYIQIGGNETVGQGWFNMLKYSGANPNGGEHDA
ncbi:MAG: type III-B CRISPR module RAMP protein Cmr4 [Marinosulfonomonas sp.]|nr:type III-B CRISPR module RAMP protein Cmr4 [Marinosulfonomonas sp.]